MVEPAPLALPCPAGVACADVPGASRRRAAAFAALALGAAALLGARPVRADDDRELLVALARPEPQPVLRSAPSPVPTLSSFGDQVVFDHRGTHLAAQGSGGILVWDRTKWVVTARIDLTAGLDAIAFSPDDKYLYAGGGGGSGVLARYDVTTGLLDRAYEGQRGQLTAMALSGDGQTLCSLSLRDRKLLAHDTETGTVLRAGLVGGFRLQSGPGGTGLLHRGGETGWILESFRTGQPAPLALPEPAASLSSVAACDDPDLLVLVNREVEPPYGDAAGSLTVLRREGAAWRAVREVTLESATMLQRRVLSPDGKFLAAAGDGNVVRLWTVPDLVEFGQVQFPPDYASKCGIRGLSFSPDDALLAVGWGTSLPGLVRIDRAPTLAVERLQPWAWHADSVTSVEFSRDGSLVHTASRHDSTVCVWDSATLALKTRYSLPERFVAIGNPDAWADPDSFVVLPFQYWREPRDWPEGCPAKVVDANTGRVRFDVRLPAGYDPPTACSLPGGRLLLVGTRFDRICRFDLARGAILDTTKMSIGLGSGSARIWVDGDALFLSRTSIQRGDEPSWHRVDLTTGKTVEVRAAESLAARQFGLVPGGRYAFTADPEFRLYERATLAEVSRRPLAWGRPDGVVFSGDGRRYATIRDAKGLPDAARKRVPAGTRVVVTVEETLSGRTLFAAPRPDFTRLVALDRDGGRVVVVGEDGGLSLWRVPPTPR